MKTKIIFTLLYIILSISSIYAADCPTGVAWVQTDFQLLDYRVNPYIPGSTDYREFCQSQNINEWTKSTTKYILPGVVDGYGYLTGKYEYTTYYGYKCPTEGQIKINDVCVDCPTGRVLGESPNEYCAPLCDYSDENRVPGSIWAGENCVQPPCGEGEILIDGSCRNNCVPPEVVNQTTGACFLPPCPEGEIRDIEDVCTDEDGLCPDKTHKDENGLCPENYCSNGSPKDAQGHCPEDYCPDGSLKSGGTCPDPPEECWDGSDKPENGECPPDPRCGSGYHFDVEEDECVPDGVDCGEGMQKDKYGNCVPIPPDCPDGKILWNGNCVDPEPTPPGATPCPIGKYRVNGECVTPDGNEGPGEGTNGSGGDDGTGSTGNGDGQEGGDPDGKEEGDEDGKKGYWGNQPGKEGVEKGYGGERTYDFSPLRNAVNEFENNSLISGVEKLQSMYQSLSSHGEAPVFRFPVMGEEMVVDLAIVEPAADILRIMLSMLIYSGLIWLIAKQWRML